MKKINIDIDKLRGLIDNGLSLNEISKELNITRSLLRKRIKEYGFKCKYKVKHSEKSRKIISDKRKKWLQENSDKHPWRKKSKFVSVPCEQLKQKLRNSQVIFVEEFQPLLDLNKFYSIDIAFPDKKIGIEINGNQHYNKDGTLKEYYQNRHNLIEKEGWKLYELHYSLVYNIDLIFKIINEINNQKTIIDFDFDLYTKNKLKNKKRSKISEIDPNWRNKPRLNQRKVNRPSKEILEKEVWNIPTTQLAKKYGVSDVAISRWCENYNISKPPVGYWRRFERGESKEQILSTASEYSTIDKNYWINVEEKKKKALNFIINTDLSDRKIEKLSKLNRLSISEMRLNYLVYLLVKYKIPLF